jgi:hypothetical protein
VLTPPQAVRHLAVDGNNAVAKIVQIEAMARTVKGSIPENGTLEPAISPYLIAVAAVVSDCEKRGGEPALQRRFHASVTELTGSPNPMSLLSPTICKITQITAA